MTLQLDDEIYSSIRRHAAAAGLTPIDWALSAIERYRVGSAEAVSESMDVPGERAEQIETRIDGLYDELRALVARSGSEPGLRGAIDEKRRQLVELQEGEAELAEHRATSRLRIQPGAGYSMLERVEKLFRS